MNIHVIKLPKNSGTPGLPRNVGIQFARGKYIAFLDSDDLFTKTALEELTTLAEKYQVEVVNMPSFFVVEDKWSNLEDLINPTNHIVWQCTPPQTPRLEQVMILPDDIAERVKFWLGNQFHWATCGLFCRRDFLAVNKIAFPDMLLCEDQIVQFTCLCFAEKLLSVPNITYIVRRNEESASRKNISMEKYFHNWVSSLKVGCYEFDKIMNGISFFKEHPDYRYAVMSWFFNRAVEDARYFSVAYAQIHPATLNPLVEREFHSDDAAFAAYLFNTVNIQRLQIIRLHQELAKFQKQ